MIYYGIIRFIIQFFRNGNGLNDTWFAFGHLWSVVSIIFGALTLILLNYKNNHKHGKIMND